jgi:hypothetical protein
MARQEGVMPTQEQMEAIKRRDDELYERYAKHLEEEHKGKFVAIGLDGELLMGENHAKLLWDAVEKFGSGNFALRRIGYPHVLKWR